MGATSVTGIGKGAIHPSDLFNAKSVPPRNKIVSVSMSPEMHNLLKKFAKLKNTHVSGALMELLESKREEMLEEIHANLEMPKGSMGHLMGEFYKEMKSEKSREETRKQDWGAGQ